MKNSNILCRKPTKPKSKTLKKIAIVIGATGLVGSHLLSYLVKAKHISRIVVITRRPMKFRHEKVNNHVIDFSDLANHGEFFRGDILFSCLGSTVKQAGSIAAQRKVDLEYQLTAARLAFEQGVSHYLLVSSSGADEKSLSPYLRMKGELEVAIQALAFKHISIIQPSLLLGERDQPRFAESLGSKVLPILCKFPRMRRYRPIHGAEVAQKMVMLSKGSTSTFERISLDEVFPN
jgi:uncharacterized protein YbjT (DUF2867 family)